MYYIVLCTTYGWSLVGAFFKSKSAVIRVYTNKFVFVNLIKKNIVANISIGDLLGDLPKANQKLQTQIYPCVDMVVTKVYCVLCCSAGLKMEESTE